MLQRRKTRERGLARITLRTSALSVTLVLASGVSGALARRDQRPVAPTSAGPQMTWASPGTAPESDTLAASQITPVAENRPDNRNFNDYVPSNFQLRRFRETRTQGGRTAVELNPLLAHVTGQSHLPSPSTDDLIQWAAHKWGVPEDWIRAIAVYESWWRQDAHGDLRLVPRRWYDDFPAPVRESHRTVFEEMGIGQIKWLPDESINPGTRRLRWRSTAFNLDYMGATIRFYYEGDCTNCGAGYGAGQQWLSIAAWHAPKPWGNAKATAYIAAIQQILAARTWTSASFQRPCAVSLSVGQCEHRRFG
jgi:hypothetical protein